MEDRKNRGMDQSEGSGGTRLDRNEQQPIRRLQVGNIVVDHVLEDCHIVAQGAQHDENVPDGVENGAGKEQQQEKHKTSGSTFRERGRAIRDPQGQKRGSDNIHLFILEEKVDTPGVGQSSGGQPG